MVNSQLIIETEERTTLERIASLDNIYGQRSRALLALAGGSTQAAAAAEADLTLGQMKYALRIFRERKLSMFPDEVLDSAEAQPTPKNNGRRCRQCSLSPRGPDW